METRDKYSKRAKIYDWVESKLPMNVFKEECVSQLVGEVLEVGIGSGANLKLYPQELKITGIDFSNGMLEIAQKKIESLGLENVKLLEMDIENMKFQNNSFDSVLSTCVFCTVPNPERGIEEIYRVLKPGGQAIFLEHMRSRSRVKNLFLKLMQWIINPIMGTFLLRETEKTIRGMKFAKVESRDVMMGDVMRIIIATK